VDSCSPSGGASDVVLPEHLQTTTGISWVQHGNAPFTANVVKLRPLDTTLSPTVQTIYGPRPIWSKSVFDPGHRFLAEAVTDKPHGFHSGQKVVISSRTPLHVVAGKFTWNTKEWPSLAFVTSPTTFVINGYAGALPATRPTDIEPIDTPGATATVTVS